MRIASLLLLTLIGVTTLAVSAHAESFTWWFEREYSGAFAPTGDAPWLTANFQDGDPDEVLLTMSVVGLTGDEYVKEWLFNFAGDDPTDLSFEIIGRTGRFNSPDINTGLDAFHAAGDGYYDIQFGFAVSNRDAMRFGPMEELIVSITGDDIDAAMFDIESAPGPGGTQGPFLSVAHLGTIEVLGAEDEGSGWVTVPDASTLFLLGSACLIGFGVSRKRSGK
jgi:hypothetical protein